MTRDYFIGVDARELERLQHQHAAWEPETEALWRAAGFGAGQHLADLGCGPGYTTLELASIAGENGSVLGIDKARPYLEHLERAACERGLSNVRVMQADVTVGDFVAPHPDPLPARGERDSLSVDVSLAPAGGEGRGGVPVGEGRLDGVFCRFFLAFLTADLDRTLATIHRSLKPGGVLAAMEYLTLDSTTATPAIPGFDAHTRAWVRYYAQHGGDTSVGQALPAKLERAGFTVMHRTAAGGVADPKHRWWGWWGRLIADFGGKLAAEGLMTRDELRALEAGWKAASKERAFIHTPLLLQVVARKAG